MPDDHGPAPPPLLQLAATPPVHVVLATAPLGTCYHDQAKFEITG